MPTDRMHTDNPFADQINYLLAEADLARQPVHLVDLIAFQRGWGPLRVGKTMEVTEDDGTRYRIERIK